MKSIAQMAKDMDIIRPAADNHNRDSKKLIGFQTDFMEVYPEVRPFLPDTHHFFTDQVLG